MTNTKKFFCLFVWLAGWLVGWLAWLVHFSSAQFSLVYIFFTDFWWLAIYFRLYYDTFYGNCVYVRTFIHSARCLSLSLLFHQLRSRCSLSVYCYLTWSYFTIVKFPIGVLYVQRANERANERPLFLTLQIDISMIAIHCPMIFILPSQRNSTSCSIKPPSFPLSLLSRAHVNSISNLYLFHKLLLYEYQLVISQNVTSSKSNNEIKNNKHKQTAFTHTHTHRVSARAGQRDIFIHMSLNCMQPNHAKQTDTHDIDYFMCKYASFVFAAAAATAALLLVVVRPQSNPNSNENKFIK